MENTNPAYQYTEQDANANYSYSHTLADHQQVLFLLYLIFKLNYIYKQSESLYFNLLNVHFHLFNLKMLEEQKEPRALVREKMFFSDVEVAARLSTPSLSFYEYSCSEHSTHSSLDFHDLWTLFNPLSQGSDSALDHSGLVDAGSLFHGSFPENVPASCQASGSYAPQDTQMQIESLEQGVFDRTEAPTLVEPCNKAWNPLKDTVGTRSPTPDLSFTSTASSWSSGSLVSSSLLSQACSAQPSPQELSRLYVPPALEYIPKAQPKSNPSARRRYVRKGDTHKETRIKQLNLHRTKAKSNDSRETIRQRQSLFIVADLEAIDGKCRSIQAFRTRPAKGAQPEQLHGQQSLQSAPRVESFNEKMHASKSSALAPVITTNLQSDSSSETEDSCDDIDYSDSSFPDSPNSTERTNIVRPVLSPLKQDLVNRVMVEFYRLFDTSFRIRRHEDGAGESGSQDTPIREQSQKTSDGTSGPGGQKRKSRDGDSSPPDGGNDDPNKRGKVGPSTPASKLPRGRKLACPFFKHNPSEHLTNRACVYPGFPNISRVKEHLYRNHALPIQCPRCCQTFSDEEDCIQHQKALRGCERKEGAPLEGVSKAQEAKLRSKKRSISSLPDEAKWKVIYKILFPQVADDQIPSACKDPSDLINTHS